MYYKSNPGDYTRCEKCKHIDRENEKSKITNDNWLVSDRAGTCHQYEEVKMLVKCINTDYFNERLEKGKIYNAKKFEDDENYWDIEINGHCGNYFLKERFEIVEEDKNYFGSTNINVPALEITPKHMRKLSKDLDKVLKDIREDDNPIKPNHYKTGSFDVIAFCFEHDLDFATGNIIKYVTRAGKKDKDKTIEDLLKAQEYLDRLIRERRKAND